MPQTLARKHPENFKTLALHVEASAHQLCYQGVGQPLNFSQMQARRNGDSVVPRTYAQGPEGDQGHAGEPNPLHPRVTYYPHPATSYDFVVEKAVHPDGLVVGSTSMHGAMHLAAHMGAANIIMVGADCGRIDGKFNHEGYTSGNLETSDPDFWLARWETHLRQVKAYLCDRYDVNIYSLNPFLNMNLEGHEWRGSNPITQRSSTALCKTCGMHCADLH